jgi:transcriptional regulator with XRE-family HTH domain
MGFSKKIKNYFKERGITQRKVGQIMNWNELSVSRAMKSDDLSITFIEKLIEYFPEIDLNYLLKNNKEDGELSEMNEPSEMYKKLSDEEKLIEEIEDRLNKLKTILARNCHEK